MKWFYILIISLLFSCSFQENKKQYAQKMMALQNFMRVSDYSILIDSFKEVDGRFPDSLNEIYLVYKHYYPEDIGNIELSHFIDIFNKKRRWVGYFPIYNSDDSEIISYLILSAGIDGKLDNFNDSANKLHVDDWKQKLNLYNPDEFDGINIYTENFDESGQYGYARKAYIEARPYSAKEEKSGNKDLLVHVHHLLIKYDKNDENE